VHTPPEIQEEIDLVEVEVRVLIHFISNEEVKDNVWSWVLDLGSMRARESQYFITIDLYWHLKFLMGKVLVEKHESHKEIILQLDNVQLQVNLVDHKLNLLAEKVLGIDFTNLNYP
jgi:hypothetical protein